MFQRMFRIYQIQRHGLRRTSPSYECLKIKLHFTMKNKIMSQLFQNDNVKVLIRLKLRACVFFQTRVPIINEFIAKLRWVFSKRCSSKRVYCRLFHCIFRLLHLSLSLATRLLLQEISSFRCPILAWLIAGWFEFVFQSWFSSDSSTEMLFVLSDFRLIV